MLPVIPKNVSRFKSKFLPAGPFDYVPFTVGQESVLLAVQDTKEKKEQVNAIRQIIKECITTPNYDVDSIPVFVLELIFIRLREKSVGEMMEFNYICKHKVEGEAGETKECNTPIDVSIDLRKVDMREIDGHETKVMITDTIGIKFKYPDFDMLMNMEEGMTEVDTIVSCIDFIFDGDDIHYAKDQKPEDLIKWYKNLDMKEKVKIHKVFLLSAPHIFHEQELTCKSCGTKHKLQFTELTDFFG